MLSPEASGPTGSAQATTSKPPSMAPSDSRQQPVGELVQPAKQALPSSDPPSTGAAPGMQTVLARVADFNQLPQGLLLAAEQYLLASEQRGGQSLRPAAQGANMHPDGMERTGHGAQASRTPLPSTPTVYPNASSGGASATDAGMARQVSASAQTGPTVAASAGVQAGAGLPPSVPDAPPPQAASAPVRPAGIARPQLILPRPPTPRSVGVPTASPRFFLPSGAAVTVTTTHGHQQQARLVGQPRVGPNAPPGSHTPTVFRIELNPNGPPRTPALSPLGPAGTPAGGSQQWGSNPLGNSLGSGPLLGGLSQPEYPQSLCQAGPSGGLGGLWSSQTPMSHGQTGEWPSVPESSEGGSRHAFGAEGLQGLYPSLSSPYGGPSPRDLRALRGGSSIRPRGRGRGRGRGRRGVEDGGFFGLPLTPGFLLASTNAIQEAVQRTVAGMTPEQIRQVARLYGVTGETVDIPSPNSVVSHMVTVFSNTADALARRGQQAPTEVSQKPEEVNSQGREQQGENEKKAEGIKDENAEPKVGADVELFVSEALVEPKGTEETSMGALTPALKPPTDTAGVGVPDGLHPETAAKPPVSAVPNLVSGAQNSDSSARIPPGFGQAPANAPASAVQPSVGTAQPAISGAQPVVSGAQPGAHDGVSGAQPTVSGAQAAVSGAQPAVSAAQSAVSGAQPAVSPAQPTVSGAQPTISTTQPAVRAALPEVSPPQDSASVEHSQGAPASTLPAEAGKPNPKPRVQVPSTGPESLDNLTPRTVLSEHAPTPPSTGPYAGTPTLRPRGESESALDSLFPASRFVVQEAMQKAVQGIQQDHSAVMGRAMMAGNLGLVQAAVATAEARLTAVFNIAVKEIAEQIGREAAARVIAAENRAAQADRMLKDTKEQAMAMIKRIQDSFQRRLAQVETRAALDLKKAAKKKRPRVAAAPSSAPESKGAPTSPKAADIGGEKAAVEGGSKTTEVRLAGGEEEAPSENEGWGGTKEKGEKDQPASSAPVASTRPAVKSASPVSTTPKRTLPLQKRKKRTLAEDEPIMKLRKLLSARAKIAKPRPKQGPPQPGLEILRKEPNLGLLSVVAEVMDSEDEGPSVKALEGKERAKNVPEKSSGEKKAKLGGPKKGDATTKALKIVKGVKKGRKQLEGGRPAGPRDPSSDTESDEETVPIAKRKKLVTQESFQRGGPPVVKFATKIGRTGSIREEEETPVVRLNKLPAGLEKAMAARVAEKGDKKGGSKGERAKGGETNKGGESGESEATVAEGREEIDVESEGTSPRARTSSVNKLSRRKPVKGPPEKAGSGATKRPRQQAESALEPPPKVARTTRQDAAVGRTKSGRKTTSAFVRQSPRNLDKGADDMDTRNKRRLMQGARQLLAMAKMRR